MKRLLIVVDMQNDFITGSLGTKEAQAAVEPVVNKVLEYQNSRDEVVFTLDTHFEDYADTQEGRKLPVPDCIKGTDGWKLCPQLEDFEGKRFEKHTFGSVECAAYAAKGGYDQIELVGVCTDICVVSNALLIKAYLPETPIAVDSACCAGVTPESHKASLETMKMCQIDVR